MNMSAVNGVLEKLWEKKASNFILSQRLCFKHMKQFVLKNKLKNEDADNVQLLGVCNKCHKMGIVYYLDWK